MSFQFFPFSFFLSWFFFLPFFGGVGVGGMFFASLSPFFAVSKSTNLGGFVLALHAFQSYPWSSAPFRAFP